MPKVKQYVCDWCETEYAMDEMAKVTFDTGEGKAKFKICPECSDECFNKKLSKAAKEREYWINEELD